MKSYFAYIRVSTTRQGEEGVSLQEQKRAILEYASRNGITIAEWFEEQESAAKRGRPVFTKLVIGLIKLRGRKDVYAGLHAPLIPSSLFNDVQLILDGKRSCLRTRHHGWIFPHHRESGPRDCYGSPGGQ